MRWFFIVSSMSMQPPSWPSSGLGALADELHQILVAGNDGDVPPAPRGCLGIGGDQVVRLQAVLLDARQAESARGIADQRELRHQVFRRGRAVGLVMLVKLVAERMARLVEDDGQVGGTFGLVEVLGQLPQHGSIAIDRAHGGSFGVGQRRQPVIGAKDVGRTVDEIEMLLATHSGLLAVFAASVIGLVRPAREGGSPHLCHISLAWPQLWPYLGSKQANKAGFG
jgi:hypothetical protein